MNNLLINTLLNQQQQINSSPTNGYSNFSSNIPLKQKYVTNRLSSQNIIQSFLNSPVTNNVNEIIGDQMYGSIAILSKKECLVVSIFSSGHI